MKSDHSKYLMPRRPRGATAGEVAALILTAAAVVALVGLFYGWLIMLAVGIAAEQWEFSSIGYWPCVGFGVILAAILPTRRRD